MYKYYFNFCFSQNSFSNFCFDLYVTVEDENSPGNYKTLKISITTIIKKFLNAKIRSWLR